MDKELVYFVQKKKRRTEAQENAAQARIAKMYLRSCAKQLAEYNVEKAQRYFDYLENKDD
jgi:hypothetical protein